jgi:hypothetical protein
VANLDQRSIVVFLHLKGFSAKVKDVHTELADVLGSDAIAYSTVTKYIRKMSFYKMNQKPRIEDRGSSRRSPFLDYRQCNSGGT